MRATKGQAELPHEMVGAKQGQHRHGETMRPHTTMLAYSHEIAVLRKPEKKGAMAGSSLPAFVFPGHIIPLHKAIGAA
jgi:hypothetical protein